MQQQGSPLLSALLSAYPLTAPLIAQLVTTNVETGADFSLTRFETACCAVCPVVELHALFGPVFFPLSVSVDILLNRSQQLFASCTAKFADGQQCSIPVFDITHQTPLCEEHAKKMVTITKLLINTCRMCTKSVFMCLWASANGSCYFFQLKLCWSENKNISEVF